MLRETANHLLSFYSQGQNAFVVENGIGSWDVVVGGER